MCISYLATLRMVLRAFGAVRNLELGNGSRRVDDQVDWLCGVDAIPRFWKVGGMRAQGAWVVSTPEMRNTSSIDPRVESFEWHGRRETVFDKKWAGCVPRSAGRIIAPTFRLRNRRPIGLFLSND